MPYQPTCSVVIATRDRPDVAERCISAVLRQTLPVSEILLVDSAPERARASAVATRAGVRYLAVDRPGASRARNAGARAARGEIILFLDDDAIAQPDCVAGILNEFADPTVMAVAGRTLLSGRGEVESLFESYGAFDVGSERRVIDSDRSDWFELVNFGGIGAGAVMAFRSSAFAIWPGFDERLGRGALQDCSEEPHAYFSLVARGFKVLYTPAAVVTHPAPSSLAELRRRQLREAAGAAAYMCLLFAEHPGYRLRVLRYALEAIRGTPRAWRPRPTHGRHVVVPRWRERFAWAAGPLLYLRMRARTLGQRVPGMA
jgi:cellulose synthase/poly-beta-1,6-N-acetylglucosamine synthase-like glycosyltransferase